MDLGVGSKEFGLVCCSWLFFFQGGLKIASLLWYVRYEYFLYRFFDTIFRGKNVFLDIIVV